MPLYGEDLVTRTKFIPPRLKGAQVVRERLHRILEGAREVPLTLVVAGAGYGKSTLLAAYLEATGTPGLWYELGERDADPQVLGLHLAHLCHRAFPGAADHALAALARPGGAAVHWAAAAEALADGLLDRPDQHTFLVLDDFEALDRATDPLRLVNHFVAHLPPLLHVVLASRTRPALPNLARWRLDGDVLMLDQGALAFDAAEAAALLRHLGGDQDAAARLVADTAGWPMAIWLLARRAMETAGGPVPERRRTDRRRSHAEQRPTDKGRGGSPGGPVRPHLERRQSQADRRSAIDSERRRDLFDYLAREVVAVLDPAERDFLLATAPLLWLDAAVCEFLAPGVDAGALLADLADRGILSAARPGDAGPKASAGAFRPHHLFREFLLARLEGDRRLPAAHRAAAEALARLERLPEAIDQLLEAGDHDAAMRSILATGPNLVRQGMFETVSAWIRRLPDAPVDREPEIALLMGDACRLAARYDAALLWYDRALAAADGDPDGRSRALAGKAQVFLDTVRPALAAALLEEAAVTATEPAWRASLQVMLAENALNQGHADKAARFLDAAAPGVPGAAEVQGRLLLRTGRLREAREWLRGILAREEEGAINAHREAALVLSLVEAFAGDAGAARSLALHGLERARAQGAAWGEAVGLIRVGHAALVEGDLDLAESCYRDALLVADTVGVDRLVSEPLVGLTVIAGRRRDLTTAEGLARRAGEIAGKYGDHWMGALVQLGWGVALGAAEDRRGEPVLDKAASAFARVADPHGEVRARLWAARLAIALGGRRDVRGNLTALAARIRDLDLAEMLERPTFLGFGSAEEVAAFAKELPPSAAAADALRVRALGAFRAFRGSAEIDRKTWSRKIALQLFHVLLVHRGDALPKSRIIDLLWPDIDPAVADGTFRVALNALNRTLEPDRPPGRDPRFVVRQGGSYGLRRDEDLWIDAAEFERLLDASDVLEAAGEDPAELRAQALGLHEGDFLAEFTEYGSWCDRERERLAGRFADGAARLARQLLDCGDAESCGRWAARLIAQDPCSEAGYRLLMAAQYRLGDRTGALRTYERCVEALAGELDVEPMPETVAVYEAILRQGAI